MIFKQLGLHPYRVILYLDGRYLQPPVMEVKDIDLRVAEAVHVGIVPTGICAALSCRLTILIQFRMLRGVGCDSSLMLYLTSTRSIKDGASK